MRLLLDVDTGVDDAVALVLAMNSPEAEVVATAQTHAQEFASWVVSVEPTVGDPGLGDDWQSVTYKRSVEAQIGEEAVQVEQIVIVNTNARTGEVSIAVSQ